MRGIIREFEILTHGMHRIYFFEYEAIKSNFTFQCYNTLRRNAPLNFEKVRLFTIFAYLTPFDYESLHNIIEK